MNNLWKSIGIIFLAVVLFFLYSYVFMMSWNNGIIVAVPNLLGIDFFTACWIMLGMFLVKVVSLKYTAKSQGAQE